MITLREIRESEYGLLKDFLYEAIFIPEGVEPPAKEIVEQPELKRIRSKYSIIGTLKILPYL